MTDVKCGLCGAECREMDPPGRFRCPNCETCATRCGHTALRNERRERIATALKAGLGGVSCEWCISNADELLAALDARAQRGE